MRQVKPPQQTRTDPALPLPQLSGLPSGPRSALACALGAAQHPGQSCVSCTHISDPANTPHESGSLFIGMYDINIVATEAGLSGSSSPKLRRSQELTL
jgi:hypothetical protein